MALYRGGLYVYLIEQGRNIPFFPEPKIKFLEMGSVLKKVSLANVLSQL